ncbi:GNAT family N-acetyltransferase [Tamlana sp. 2201CG12-4]|uniref:GNAT family N-acetyltransferase n=1 Tax=Tamlana sp. 2201CG12-4 TaxID=3112582 RepID=UPI002DBBAA49|nr:GNAT family N-acetyltransferase [Tamlana sp. 2201CG12-4]MEC3908025.1 GNAT family N-acetyltransferase [Tamlana sp. 2201CG12-4]
MINSPFSNPKFIETWSAHFNNSKLPIKFRFINNVSFIKSKYLPLYVNVGKNLTNGIFYKLENDETDYKKKVFFLYDIPEYFKIQKQPSSFLKIKSIKQYNGYLLNIKEYLDTEDYFKKKFSSKSRWKIKRAKKRLESCLNIKYDVLYGPDTSKQQYDMVFDYFNKLLKKREAEKKVNNHNLSTKKWNYLYDLVYPLILEKKAALFVIYNDNIPISIYLNYISDNVLFSAFPVFDNDYSKFNVGYVDNLKHVEWCFENNKDIFDFSKGDYKYKKRLANKEYKFEYHVLYDSKSLRSVILAKLIILYFYIKQYFREKEYNILFHKFLFFFKQKNLKTNDGFETPYIKSMGNEYDLTKIEFYDEQYSFLKRNVLDFLFKHSESLDSINIYKINNEKQSYLIEGKKHIQKIIQRNKQL